MFLLVGGLLVLACVQIAHNLAPIRGALIKRFATGAYLIAYCAVVLVALALIIAGKSRVPFIAVWWPPASLRLFVLPLMFVGFVIAAAEVVPSNLRRWLRQPLMAGATLWFLTHLLFNGDLARMTLFGGLALIGCLSVALGLREPFQKPAPLPWTKESLVIAIGGCLFMVLFFLHNTLFGVSPTMMPGTFF
ncbi:MAG: NnrU family protein [Proteobacteria bacterium]|nr:NnrU family protein [Pseudomonadota bacterium]